MSVAGIDFADPRTATPRVSVLMAVYNTERYLREAVESVLAQSFRDLELVAVDDGSTDGSGSILRELAARDERLRVLTVEHEGYGAVMRRATQAARGELLAIMDSDDVMLPGRIARQVAFLDDHPEIAAVGGQWFFCDEELRPLEIDFHSTDAHVTRTLSCAYQSVHHGTVCLRKTALDAAGGFDPRDQISADTGFYARLILAGGSIVSLPHLVMKWRRNPTGITHGRALEQTLIADRVRRSVFSEFQRRDARHAADVARAILETFPEGTYFDAKFRSLTGRASREYLFAALPPPRDARETAKQLVFKWFDDPAAVSETLETALRDAGLAVEADLLALHDGRAPPRRTNPPLPAGRETAEVSPRVSVLAPFDGDREDLAARIDLLAACEVPADAIVFPLRGRAASERELTHALGERAGVSVTFVPGGFAAALASVRSGVLGYLLPRHRYQPDAFRAAVGMVTRGRAPVTCVALRKVYPFAMIDDAPAVEPIPPSSKEIGTLLGQGRVCATSFVHRAELLDDLPIAPSTLCDDGLEQMLTCFLGHDSRAVVTAGHHDVLVDDVRLRDESFARFSRRLVMAYFDGGGALPCERAIASLPEDRLRLAILAADARYRAGRLRLYYANANRLRSALGRLPSLALRTALGREIWRTMAAELRQDWRAGGHEVFVRAALPVRALLRAQRKLARLSGMR